MIPVDIRIDVSDALADVFPDETLTMAAWVFVPGVPRRIGGRVPVLVMLHGATYDRRYWHFADSAGVSHSFAEHLSDAGAVVVLLDHLGVGDSSRPADGHRIDRHVAARAAHAATERIFAGLRSGTLISALPPLPALLKIGGGHSMGAMVLVTQQAEHGSFDGLVVTGYTAIGVHMLSDGQLVSGDMSPVDYAQPPYMTVPHAFVRESFFWPDMREDLVATDDAMTVDVPYVLIVQSSTAGIIAQDAARITVPVYICLGENDVSPRPADEPGLYERSADVRFHRLPRSGHCQTFADTRREMFDGVADWIATTPFTRPLHPSDS